MKKNWFSFIMAVISAVAMIVIGKLAIDFVVDYTVQADKEVLDMFKSAYMTVVYAFAVINVLFGVWSIFKKGGCTALTVFGIFLVIAGGMVIFLVSAILNIVGGSKGKTKFIKYQAEQEAAKKYQQL